MRLVEVTYRMAEIVIGEVIGLVSKPPLRTRDSAFGKSGLKVVSVDKSDTFKYNYKLVKGLESLGQL